MSLSKRDKEDIGEIVEIKISKEIGTVRKEIGTVRLEMNQRFDQTNKKIDGNHKEMIDKIDQIRKFAKWNLKISKQFT